ncbi:transcriptional regulatory protein AlgP-like [Drosophila busckii]|uniref:transcriptional regulatory protein AlgP-like n=1 Tax=Drosophila busckii TaxID=30019 RepID=UPI0014332C16|nr:transcriptional regulatory protein AlgP-like [Drosophila busckii]
MRCVLLLLALAALLLTLQAETLPKPKADPIVSELGDLKQKPKAKPSSTTMSTKNFFLMHRRPTKPPKVATKATLKASTKAKPQAKTKAVPKAKGKAHVPHDKHTNRKVRSHNAKQSMFQASTTTHGTTTLPAKTVAPTIVAAAAAPHAVEMLPVPNMKDSTTTTTLLPNGTLKEVRTKAELVALDSVNGTSKWGTVKP